jgi:hypothetical protein
MRVLAMAGNGIPLAISFCPGFIATGSFHVSDESRSAVLPSSCVLPVLRALADGRTDLDLESLQAPVVAQALRCGLGPVLAHVTAGGTHATSPYASRIRAADLTARVLTAEKYGLLGEVLTAAEAAGGRVVLLKGISTALRYYPAPHLRTMGDIDLLVSTAGRPALEWQLRRLGFQQTSHEPAEAFVRRHHSMPFWHPERRVWIEVHTSLHPPQHALARNTRCSFDALQPDICETALPSGRAWVMNHERQLVYTSARWAETFEHRRGIFPLLDAALLLKAHGADLDWDRVRALVDGSWAATALRLMLTQLSKLGLAQPPDAIVDWLAATDRHGSHLSLWLLNGVITRYLVAGKPFGRVLATRDNVAALWGSMVRPGSPWVNVARVPYSVGGSVYRSRFRRRALARGSRARDGGRDAGAMTTGPLSRRQATG